MPDPYDWCKKRYSKYMDKTCILSECWNGYLERFAQYDFSNVPQSTDRYCVIVEPRDSPLLVQVSQNVMFHLAPKGWGLIVFHGTTNQSLCRQHIPNAHLVSLGRENLSIEDYNALLTSVSFWDQLLAYGCQKCLIFQLDALVLRDNIHEFLSYDYIGAPFKVKQRGLMVGNGGLSLRTVEKMKYICQNYPRTRMLTNEDIFFSFYCNLLGFHLPSVDIAKSFSVEGIYYPHPFGLHKPLLSSHVICSLLSSSSTDSDDQSRK